MRRSFSSFVIVTVLVLIPCGPSGASAEPKVGDPCPKSQWGFTVGASTCRSEPFKGGFRYVWKIAAPLRSTASKPCRKAFDALEIAANDVNADETSEQTATMTACESRSEWKAGAAKHQGKMFPSAKSLVTLDRVLDAMCSDTTPKARACTN